MGSIQLVQCPADPRNILTLSLFVSLATLFYYALWVWPNSLSGCGAVTGSKSAPLWGILLLAVPYLPASNLLLRVGFVVAERILYLPRWVWLHMRWEVSYINISC